VPLPADGVGCVFCDGPSESSVHLFISCLSFFPVWYQVLQWLGWALQQASLMGWFCRRSHRFGSFGHRRKRLFSRGSSSLIGSLRVEILSGAVCRFQPTGWGVFSVTGPLSPRCTCSFLVCPSSRCGIRCCSGWDGSLSCL